MLASTIYSHLITFIADQKLACIFWCEFIDFCQPVIDVIKALHVGDIVDHNYAVSAAVVCTKKSKFTYQSRLHNSLF